jgi:hypothetical protein
VSRFCLRVEPENRGRAADNPSIHGRYPSHEPPVPAAASPCKRPFIAPPDQLLRLVIWISPYLGLRRHQRPEQARNMDAISAPPLTPISIHLVLVLCHVPDRRA